MTRNEFMAALRRRLSHLPLEEQDAAMKYYEEYFDEAASEEEAAKQLGSPDVIADRILGEYVPPAQPPQPETAPAQNKHSAGFWAIIVILCIFASPVLLGLGAAVLGFALAAIVCAVSIIIAVVAPFATLCIALVACFFALFYAGAVAIGIFPAGGVLLFGIGLLCGGFGLLNGVFTCYLCKWIGQLCRMIYRAIRGPKKEKISHE